MHHPFGQTDAGEQSGMKQTRRLDRPDEHSKRSTELADAA